MCSLKLTRLRDVAHNLADVVVLMDHQGFRARTLLHAAEACSMFLAA